MKKIIILVLFVLCLAMPMTSVSAKTYKSNMQIVKMLCRKQHRPFKIVSGSKAYKALAHRKGKKTLIVEKIVTYSNGKKGGFGKEGYMAYNKRVKKGKKVISYIIYSNKSNEPDDVLWVVDNHTYR